MNHYVARAAPGRLLFSSWEEGCNLFYQLLDRARGRCAVVVMPDHVHVAAPECRLGASLRAHALYLNRRMGTSGALFERSPMPVPIEPDKMRRVFRYVWLNPPRGGLCSDPLAWPLSNYRDALGLSWADAWSASPRSMHRYVSGDPSCHVSGTPFVEGGSDRLEDVAASAWLHRVSLDGLKGRGPARTLAAAAARVLTPSSAAQIAEALGMSERSVWRSDAQKVDIARIARIAGDQRVRPLPTGPVRLPRREPWKQRW